jgi:agmatinase
MDNRCSFDTDFGPGTVVVVGLPSDENSSFMRGASQAPARIREALHSGSMNLHAENGTDLGTESCLCDLGDLDLAQGHAMLGQVSEAISQLLARDARVLALGGDHAVTYPILRAYAARFDNLSVLDFDAHPDLYDEYDGSRYSHACPFARVMEEYPALRLVQVGVRAANPHQRAQATRFGVELAEVGEWQDGFSFDFKGPVYISLDLDVLDPAFAPGVSHHEPGGLSTRELIRLIQSLDAPVVGADIVEFNPERDPLGITAMVAAKLYKEIAAKMLES